MLNHSNLSTQFITFLLSANNMHTKYAANGKAQNTEFIYPYKAGKLETTANDCH